MRAASKPRKRPSAPDALPEPVEAALRQCSSVGDFERLAGVTDRYAFWDAVLAKARALHAPLEPSVQQVFVSWRQAIREQLMQLHGALRV